MVGVEPHHRLEQGRCDLVGERDQSDLRKGELELSLQQRIDCQDQRLDHVVQKVRKTDRTEHSETDGMCLVR